MIGSKDLERDFYEKPEPAISDRALVATPAAKRKAVAHLTGLHGWSEPMGRKAIGSCRVLA
ncbi:MAG: hypothetical protein L0Y57_12120 [Beijerinckiaceae bacterium]|nr:hypothetical protein [Beijerinckiaceae bacterium]